MLKLMIAEDELLERKALQYLLTKYYQDKIEVIAEVANGKEAFSQALINHVDIILMDIKMPKLDGLKAAELIKEEMPETEIIILTAHSEFEYAQRSIHIGVSDYLVKPYSEKEFCAIMDKTINNVILKNKRKLKQKELRDKLNEIIPLLEKEIILEIIYGTKTSLDRFAEYKKLLGIDSNSFMCLVISTPQKNIFNMNLLNKVKDKIKKLISGVIGYISLQDMVFLLLGDELQKIKESIEFKDMLFEIKNDFKCNFQIDLIIGQSEVYNTVTKLNKSYNEARSLLINKEKTINEYPYEKEKLICGKIIDRDLDNAIKEFNAMFTYLIKNYQNNIIDLKSYLKEFSILLNRNIREFFGNELEIYDTRQVEKDINSFTDIIDLKVYMQSLFKKVVAEILAHKKDKKVQVIETVKSYINDNYSEDISLGEVAEHISFSQYYLSKLFKEVEGINFKDYLIKVRMEKAKILLKKGTKIKSVANLVGYTDPNYFSRAFKKYTGISPSEYI